MDRIIKLPFLTIDYSGLRSVYSGEGRPQWAGKVALSFDNGGETPDIVTANWVGRENSKAGELVDFEGDSEEVALFEACEAYADLVADEITAHMKDYPCFMEAHHNERTYLIANKLPPFDRAA
jgi:hypothetical protein